MKKNLVLFALIISTQINYGQKTVKMITEYAAKSNELQGKRV